MIGEAQNCAACPGRYFQSSTASLLSSEYGLDELDRIKLEDGVRIHEDTKVALDIFARDNKTVAVKPFVLVVALVVLVGVLDLALLLDAEHVVLVVVSPVVLEYIVF